MRTSHKKIFTLAIAVTFLLFIAQIGNIGASWQEKIIDRFYLKSDAPKNYLIIAVDDLSIKEIGQWPWPRKTFADALSKLQSTQIVAFDINFSEPSRSGVTDDNAFKIAVEKSLVKVVFPLELDSRGRPLSDPLSLFSPHVLSGYVNIPVSGDGIVRFADTERGQYQSFSSLISDAKLVGGIRINFLGPAGTISTIPFIDLINDKIPETLLEDKKIIIGATAPNLHDTLNTPFGTMSGPEVQATIAENLDNGSAKKDVSLFVGFIYILFFSLIASTIALFASRVVSLTLLFLSGLVLALVSALVLFSFGLIMPVLYGLLSFILSGAGGVAIQYTNERKKRVEIRNIFRHYLTDDIIEELVQNPEKLKLGGERRDMAMFFSDIRGFTAIAEKLGPEQLTSFMSEYFSIVSHIILDKKGVLDKYIGDAIMAFWGAPIATADYVKQAALSGTALRDALPQINEVAKKYNIPTVSLGVGINKGSVVVGNMGSENRFNYTCVGDEMNFTSRLEGLNKNYGTIIITSESVYEMLKDDTEFLFRELDTVIVKGKQIPKKIYELRSRNTTKSETSMFSLYEEGLGYYYAGKWNEAIEKFRQVLSIEKDTPSDIMITRCNDFLNNPPSDWKGVYEHKEK